MVSQALTIDVLISLTTPDLGHPSTRAGARKAAMAREDTPVRTTDAFPREHFA